MLEASFRPMWPSYQGVFEFAKVRSTRANLNHLKKLSQALFYDCCQLMEQLTKDIVEAGNLNDLD